MKETLLTCPTCNTPNFFTARGLKAHRCKGAKTSALSLHPSSFSSSAPGGRNSREQLQPVAAAPGNISDDALLGEQLTVQYHRAVGGMQEVLKFGAMMMMLRDHCDSTRGVANLGNEARRDTGVKAWLKTNAPEIKEATAYRFMHVAEMVAKKFENPGKTTFIELATTPAESLSEKQQKKQLELWDFVNGTSQRSWLDMFAPPKSSGGDRSAFRKIRDLDEEIEFQKLKAQDQFQNLVVNLEEFFLSKRDKRFELLGDADRQIILGLLIDINKANRK